MFKKPLLYCQKLRTKSANAKLIQEFYIERESDCEQFYYEYNQIYGLCQYLKHCAWEDDCNNDVKIYLIKSMFSKEIVAYFGLKAGLIADSISERDEQKEQLGIKYGVKAVPSTIPGIELSHFAINDKFKEKHNAKRLGKYLYPKFIYPIIKKVSEEIGAKIVYLYAADSSDDGNAQALVNYYSSFGFHTVEKGNDIRPVTSYYDNECIFMYQEI